MGSLLNVEGKDTDEGNQCSSPSSTKVERKVVEKNRRNQMKNLYSMLNSLLPNPTSQLEALSLPDQIDEAVNYIKSLERKLKESKEKKEKLMGRKRSSSCTRSYSTDETNYMRSSSSKSPQIEIRETGSTLEIILTIGSDSQFMFYEVIRILHEEGAEVLSANSSLVENTIFLVVHAEISDAMCSTFGGAKVRERITQFVNGSAIEGELELQFQEIWDFNVLQESWPL